MESHKELMRSYLCESLRELMVRSLFEKITIKQICDRAGVIRATFYNYFDDKYDCLGSIVRQDIGTLAEDEDIESFIRRVLQTIEENRDFYKAAYQVTGQNSFEEMVRNSLAEFLNAYLDKRRKESLLPRYSNDLLSRYYSECIAFDIREFVFHEEQMQGVEGMTRMVIDLMHTSLVDLLR